MRTPKINAPFFLIFILSASMAAGIPPSIYGPQRPHAPSSLFTEEFRDAVKDGRLTWNGEKFVPDMKSGQIFKKGVILSAMQLRQDSKGMWIIAKKAEDSERESSSETDSVLVPYSPPSH